MTSKRAVILGAGIAGLAAAVRLRQIGWEPVVVERAPARRRGGYALHLFGLGYDAVERMGTLPKLTERDFGALNLISISPDGRRRFTVPGPALQGLFGGRNLTLLRSDVEAVLYEAVRDTVQLRFGTTIKAVTQDPAGVHITLFDGTTLDADLLIGADGRHSRVRELLFGPEAGFRTDLGHVVAAFIPRQPPVGLPEGSVMTLNMPGRTANLLNPGSGRAAVFLAYASPDPAAELAIGPRAALRRAFGDLDGVVPDVLAQLDHAESVYFDTGSQITVSSWSRGRVVLLGDAAWLASVFAGYGASLAVGGADLLGAALQRHPGDVPGALTAWEAQLRPEVTRRQRQGRDRAHQQLAAGRLAQLRGELPLRLAALGPVAGLLERRAQSPAQANEDARRPRGGSATRTASATSTGDLEQKGQGTEAEVAPRSTLN
jgi:2-polyprenyl-6-methoxyphenol hydroxylase-like FAD-dependent oxidoreductase